MLLAIDIGNTNINLAVFHEDKLQKKDSLPTNLKWDKQEYFTLLGKFLAAAIWEKKDIKSVIIASVVPVMTEIFKEAVLINFNFEPIIVKPDLALGIRINFENQEEIGADRLANAVAVNYLFPHQPVIVVDFGTAITFDIIDGPKGYIGGVIAPGIAMVEQALCEKTALLPQIELIKPANVFGKSTEESMQAGIYYGMAGLIKSILENLLKTFNKKVTVIATGGGAQFLAGQIKEIEKIEPDLTLYGLWKINELNSSGKSRMEEI